MELIQTKDYLLFVDKEAEVKEGNLFYHTMTNKVEEAIHCNGKHTHPYPKCLAYHPLTEDAKSLNLPLLPNPFEEVDIELLARTNDKIISHSKTSFIPGFIEGYKAAQSKQFSLEDISQVIKKHQYKHTDDLDQTACPIKGAEYRYIIDVEDIENELKSLSFQQLPKEFIPEYEREQDDTVPFPKMMNSKVLKAITNSKGKIQLIGTYIH